jgi:hypothetical protein|tara:strand:+ start:114 stop:410 length:297 start_codon:yes stop_codon:yes gene_type:complete
MQHMEENKDDKVNLIESYERLLKEGDRKMMSKLTEINELKNKVKNMDWLKNHDYKWLIEENKKLKKELDEIKADNRNLSRQIQDKDNFVKELREKGVI